MYATLSGPITCQIELTTACVVKCLHCYNFWRSAECPTKTLKLSEIKTIIGKLSDAQVFDVVITGGEPLLAFDSLVDCIREAKKAGMSVYLNSNLVLLTKERARVLKSLGISYILTSIMGPNSAIHDEIAQRAGAFEKSVANIKLAQDEGIKIVANMVVSKINRGHVKDVGRLVHSLGVRKFTATKAGCPGNCSDFSSMELTLGEFRQYLKDLQEIGEELGLSIDALEGYPLCGVKDLNLHHWTAGRKCLAGVTSITVASDGSVRPCSHLDVSYGNLLEEDIEKIWARMDAWRTGEYLPSTCTSCKLLGVCGGGCRMEAKTHSGHLNAPDPYCSPSDIEFGVRSLGEYRARQKEQSLPKTHAEIKYFKVLFHRMRKEPFGATVTSESRSRAFLNHDGADILLSLETGSTYAMCDPRICWGNVDSVGFVTELGHKKIFEVLT